MNKSSSNNNGGNSNEDMPPFMKEFVLRRQGSLTSPGGAAGGGDPPTPAKRKSVKSIDENIVLLQKTAMTAALPQRPQSAFISRKTHNEAMESGGGKSAANGGGNRRRSEYSTKFETLMSRAQAAAKAVDNLENLDNPDEVVSEEEDIDFNEEEVLQRCQDFLKDYDRSKQRKSLPAVSPPVPKPRKILNVEDPPRPSLRTRSSSLTIHDKKNAEEKADEDQNDNEVKIIQEVMPKPILKKSSDDLRISRPILKRKDSESNLPSSSTSAAGASSTSGVSATISGASTGGASGGGILKRKSVTAADDPFPSTTTSSRPDHIRIRSPSPDSSEPIKPILLRSRNSSFGEEEFPHSILKRRSSTEDLMDGDVSASASGATSRSSPEPPVHGILKRKLSLGSHSPDQANFAGALNIQFYRYFLKISEIRS